MEAASTRDRAVNKPTRSFHNHGKGPQYRFLNVKALVVAFNTAPPLHDCETSRRFVYSSNQRPLCLPGCDGHAPDARPGGGDGRGAGAPVGHRGQREAGHGEAVVAGPPGQVGEGCLASGDPGVKQSR